MIPLNKLAPDVQKAILTLIVLSGGATATGCCVPPICDPLPPPRTASPTRSPIICDPPPPPRFSPTASRTPMICDPTPPPRTTPPAMTPSRTIPPIICDPMPPPSGTRTVTQTPVTQRRFQLRGMQMTSDNTLKGAAVRGTVYDAQGQPLGNVGVTIQSTGTIIDATTDRGGSYFIRVNEIGDYSLIVGGDKNSALPLQLKQFDVANVDWTALSPTSQLPLPLAEIRTVDILFDNSLTFSVETSWDGARFRWSVSGGALVEESDGSVTWQPPENPGRYLLQVIADWGHAGIAVDAMVFVVNEDSSIAFV